MRNEARGSTAALTLRRRSLFDAGSGNRLTEFDYVDAYSVVTYAISFRGGVADIRVKGYGLVGMSICVLDSVGVVVRRGSYVGGEFLWKWTVMHSVTYYIVIVNDNPNGQDYWIETGQG